MAEIDGITVFALHLFVDPNTNSALIYDLLINRNSYGQLSDPNSILKNMIESLESFALLSQSKNIVLTAGLIDESILKDLHYLNSKDRHGQKWSKKVSQLL